MTCQAIPRKCWTFVGCAVGILETLGVLKVLGVLEVLGAVLVEFLEGLSAVDRPADGFVQPLDYLLQSGGDVFVFLPHARAKAVEEYDDINRLLGEPNFNFDVSRLSKVWKTIET